jgi:hypothetical protein
MRLRLLHRDDPALVVCGRQIVEDIAQHSTRPLLLSIALHDNRHPPLLLPSTRPSYFLSFQLTNVILHCSRATIKEVVEAIKANRLWGQPTAI